MFSFFRRPSKHDPANYVDELNVLQAAQEKADLVLAEQYAYLLAKDPLDYAKLNQKVLLACELYFLWGFFTAFEVEADLKLKTNGYDRIKVSLIRRLTEFHDYSFDQAVKKANSVEDMFNQAEPIFEAVSAIGQKAYHDPSDTDLFAILQGLPVTMRYNQT